MSATTILFAHSYYKCRSGKVDFYTYGSVQKITQLRGGELIEENIHITSISSSKRQEEEEDEEEQSVELEFTEGPVTPEVKPENDGGEKGTGTSLGEFEMGAQVKIDLSASEVDEGHRDTAF